MTRLFASIALAAAVAGTTAPAFAAETLSLSDLDFNKAADVQTFQARVGVIQDQVCKGGQTATGSLIASQGSCRRDVESEVVSKMSSGQRKAYQATLKAQKDAGKDQTRTAGGAPNRG